MWLSRGLRAGPSARARLAAARAASPGVPWRFGDSDPTGAGRIWVPSDPYGVRSPFGCSPARPPNDRSRSGPPLRFRAPSEDSRSSPAPCRKAVRPADDASSPELSCPTTQSEDRGPDWTARPRAIPCHVRGLVTPIAASTTAPTGARSAGASMGFALQGLTRTGGTPLGAPALLTFLRGVPPLREVHRRPPSGLRSRYEHDEGSSRTPRHVLPGLSPSRALSPSVRAVACSRETNPPTLRRGDVPAHLGLRVLRSERIGLSLSGPPALMGFCTLRPSRRSVRRPGERAHDFTSRRRTLAGPQTL